jgi:NAD(P)-dependent dehydrogenase (short-subunit alcohol dehydrogenase family)
MIKNGAGSIVNISSQAGRSFSPTAGCHYTASKAGLLGLTRHMAKELACYNIRVNSVCPGVTGSERLLKRIESTGMKKQIESNIPLGRIGNVFEIANCCLFLASDLSSYMTGATLDVNGGMLMI